jgi:uncharacterized protein
MLTKELGIAEYDFQSGRYLPDRLTRGRDSDYLKHAERMLRVYRNGIGTTRRELHRQVHNLMSIEDDCPVRRIDAFCKLLDDASTYNRDSRGRAAKLRQQVFQLAADFHPLVEVADQMFVHGEDDVKNRIAKQLKMKWAAIEDAMYADIIEFHRLQKFDGYASPEDLLARYNVAQVQVALYGASSMSVWMNDDFKTILRYAKLARLMHRIAELSPGKYCLHLDGPASVLRQTRRYGVALAKFLPALVACKDWRMKANITTRQGFHLALQLSSRDGLRSHIPPPAEFDSQLERNFAEKWGDEPREGWTMHREGAVLHDGQHVFVPDFHFIHESGVEVSLEIVGFWTSEYLEKKALTIQRFGRRRVILAVANSIVEELQETEPRQELPSDTIIYKTVLKLKDVQAALAKRL